MRSHSGGDKRPLSPDAKRVLPGKLPRQIQSLLTMKQAGVARLVTDRILCMVKKNGLIVETRPLSKCYLNSIKATCFHYLSESQLITLKLLVWLLQNLSTSKNRKVGSNTTFTNSTEQSPSPYTKVFEPDPIKCSQALSE